MKKRTVVFFVITALWLVLQSVPSWGAPQYLGESTWTITITMDEHGEVAEGFSGTVNMAITRMGGNNYTVQGYIIPPDDGPVIMAGGGVLIGETMYLTLCASQKHTTSNWRDTEVLQVQLNKTTLSGTFYTVGYDFNAGSAGPSPFFDSRFGSGTITLSGNPIVLSTNLAGPIYLLFSE